MLRLTAISKRFARRPVLENVTLAAKPGTLTLLAGPNGSGKSTLLHIMAGLARPDKGSVECAARPGKIGYLGHETLIYPQMTALENLAFWCSLHGIAHSSKILLDALERLDLAARADDAAGSFSRGMAQRLSLARMLLLSPELALLDEPLTGLDAASVKRVRAELLTLKRNGAALVLVTHDLANDLAGADAALVLQRDATHELYAPDEFSRLASEGEFSRLVPEGEGTRLVPEAEPC